MDTLRKGALMTRVIDISSWLTWNVGVIIPEVTNKVAIKRISTYDCCEGLQTTDSRQGSYFQLQGHAHSSHFDAETKLVILIPQQ